MLHRLGGSIGLPEVAALGVGQKTEIPYQLRGVHDTIEPKIAAPVKVEVLGSDIPPQRPLGVPIPFNQ